MRFLVSTMLLVAIAISACTFYPVAPQAEVDARNTATAESLLPTVTATLEPTVAAIATIEATQIACDIKVNKSNSDLIYHLPGMAYYDRVKVALDQGDFWACTETEAQAAGARKSSR